MPAPYRWRTEAQNAELVARQDAEQEARRAHHRHCRQTTYFARPCIQSLKALDLGHLLVDAVGLTAYCLDRQD